MYGTVYSGSSGSELQGTTTFTTSSSILILGTKASERAVRTPAGVTTRHIRIARFRVEVKRAVNALIANSLNQPQQAPVHVVGLDIRHVP